MRKSELRLKLRIEKLRRKQSQMDMELERVYFLASRIADCAADAKAGRFDAPTFVSQATSLTKSILEGGDK